MSLAVAGVALVVAVLPAEFGIDPTGVGRALGLSSMKAPATDDIPTKDVQTLEGSAATADTVTKTESALRADTLSVTLQPGDGAEVKAEMLAGQRFVFEWTSNGGPVNFDMHGEEPGAGDQFTSYWADEQKASAAGVFVAPVDGTHGWFWRNRGDGPVTVDVKISGFYTNFFRVK